MKGTASWSPGWAEDEWEKDEEKRGLWMQVSPFGPLQNIPLQHSPGDTGPAEAPGTHGP